MANTAFEGTRTVPVDGTTLAYRELGRGEPVVFVHGGLSDLRTWEQQLPAIGRSYRAIAYSRRFARPNEDIDPDADDPMPPHVEDLAAFLRGIDAAPAHLVGNSWGAFIALLLARRHPELVRTLVLEEPPVLSLFTRTPPRVAELLRVFATRPRTAIAILRFGAGTIAPVQKAFRRGRDEEAMRTFLHGVLGEAPSERLPEARQQQMRDNLSALRAQMLGAGFPPLGDDDVRGVRAPVLLLTGEHSPAVLLRLTDRLEELLPNAQRVEIAGASHAMHEEKAAAVNQAILGFLGLHRDRRIPPSP
jgi:pimeloyl-ACP methyl ester carboxylesterase